MERKKIHRTQIIALSAALLEVFIQRTAPEKALSSILRKNRKLGSRDRSFISESFFNMLRGWRKYWNGLDEHWKGNKSELEEAIQRYLQLESPENPDWCVQQSVSRSTNELGEEELGKTKWRKELEAMNRKADVFLRVNSLRSDTREVLGVLREMGVEEVSGMPCALRSPNRIPLTGNRLFEKGCFEIQDLSSQLVIPFLDPSPGEVMIDWCAGSGGKSLHAAAYTKNKARIIATDASMGRLKKLGERKLRAGAVAIEVMTLQEILKSGIQADCILVDAPCSGSGVIRREPVKKYFLNTEEVRKYSVLQGEILRRAGGQVIGGGVLVYCTCSIFPTENNRQVKNFLAAESGWELEAEKMLWPSETVGDGFYMARIKKNT